MSSPRQIWVQFKNGAWVVSDTLTGNVLHRAVVKDEAVRVARQYAIQYRAELIITGLDGLIQERNSYGNDPFPPPG